MVLESEYIRGDEMEGEREKGISRQNERKAFIKGMNLRQGEIYQHWVKGSKKITSDLQNKTKQVSF